MSHDPETRSWRDRLISVLATAYVLGVALMGLYAGLAGYALVTGGWEQVVAEASGEAARVRREAGIPGPLGALVALGIGVACGTLVALRTWPTVARRFGWRHEGDSHRALRRR